MDYNYKIIERNGKLAIVSIAGVAFTTPVLAQSTNSVSTAVTQIESTLDALSGLAVTALGVVLIPMGIRFGLKYAKQVASKS